MRKRLATPRHRAIIQAVSSAVSRSRDLDEVLALAAYKSLEVLADGSCDIHVLDRQSGRFVLRVQQGHVGHRALTVLTADDIRLGADGGPLIIDNSRTDTSPMGLILPAAGTRSLAIFPLRTDQQLVGLLTLLSRKPRTFTAAATSLFLELAVLLATAVQNAFLYNDTMERANRFETLVRWSQKLARPASLGDVCQTVADASVELLEATVACVWLLDDRKETLHLRAHAGHPIPESLLQPINVEERIAAAALTRGEPFGTTDLSHLPGASDMDPALTADLAAMGSAPLLSGEKTLGILTVFRPEARPFSAPDLDLLQHLGTQAAGALEASRLHRILRQHTEELESHVKERTAQLQRANQTKSEFLAAMSHELRTPLNAIIGFAELLEDQVPGPLTDKQMRYVQHVLLGGRHLLDLINDILDLSKVEAGELRLRLDRISVADLLHGATLGMRQAATKKNLALLLDLPAELSEITADPLRLRQVIDNLLSNAIKFTPEGGTVTVSAREVHGAQLTVGTDPRWNREVDPHSVEVSVRDTGIGIRPDDLPKLFTPFMQLDQSLARRHEGTGLGLALSRRLVDLHGGRIWAESPGEGKGSTFRILLPVEGDTLSAQILLIDDDPGLRAALETRLRMAGYTVLALSSGPEALAKVREEQIDLVLLDLFLPEMSGQEILVALKNEITTQNIPVVVFTASMETDPKEIMHLGASEFLTKPFSDTVLLEVVKRLTRKFLPGDTLPVFPLKRPLTE